MRALVTGGGGFIGSHLVRRLVSNGADVTVTARPGSKPWRLSSLGLDVNVVPLALGEPVDTDLRAAMAGTDVVFHLAAAGVDPSKDSGADVVCANVVGTVRLLEAAAEAKVRRFVNCGSCFEYGGGSRLREDAMPCPRSEYAASKSAAWIVASAFARRYGLSVVTVRPFTVYGPQEQEYRLVPSTIAGALAGDAIDLTPGEQTRDFVYVEDVVEGILAAAEASETGTFNLCTGRETSVRELAETVVELVGTGTLRLGALPYRSTELWTLSGDPSAAGDQLGWTAGTDLRTGLLKTIEWFRARASEATYERAQA